jgi:hypothetical protein
MSSHVDEPNLEADSTGSHPLVKTIACGSVACSIFENQGQRHGMATVYYTVKISRGYRDHDGYWRYTTSFYKSQLPQLIHVCRKALEFVEDAESQPPF